MSIEKERLQYLKEKINWKKTWSRIDLKDVYCIDDISQGGSSNESEKPGEFPYTRGIHKEMYRGKLWTRREVSGYASPVESNKRLKFLLASGQTGLNIIPDGGSQIGLDSDHPLALGEIGKEGCPLCSVNDMRDLLNGIDQRDVSFTFSGVLPMILAQYICIAENRKVDISSLRGTVLSDVLHTIGCGCIPYNPPQDVGFRLSVDTIEFCAKNMPYWVPLCIDSYDLREHGITAAEEIAFGFSLAFAYIDSVLKKGVNIDEIAPRIAFTMSAHIDFLEEASKFRAARKVWANAMTYRYGAKSEKSLKLKFHANTAGSVQLKREPLNNLIRIGYQALGAVLGGVQSLHCVGFDEPICLPTETAHRLAVRTQQILAYESGAATVADPLGGSYYVESLTKQLGEEMEAIIAEIDELGGGYAVVEDGWLLSKLEDAAYGFQKEVENGERVLVGRNAFKMEETFNIQDFQKDEGEIHEIDEGAVQMHLEKLRKLKGKRNLSKAKKAVNKLKKEAKQKGTNLIPFIVEATKSFVTAEEILGTVREAYGYDYDPFGMRDNPY